MQIQKFTGNQFKINKHFNGQKKRLTNKTLQIMKKTVSTLFMVMMAVVIFSCSKSSDSVAVGTNQATIDGAVTDFSKVTTATKSSDSKTLTIMGTNGSTTATNSLYLSVKSKSALRIGSYSSTDSSTTSYIDLAVSLSGKNYGAINSTVTITKLDSLVAGTYSATVYDSSLHAKAVSGNFSSRF